METISSVPTEVMEDFLAIQPLVGCVIEKDLNKHFTKTENIEGSILEDFLKTSIALANSGVVVDDYGCYTFGIMKALDGLISKRLLEDAPDFKDYGTYFERGKDGNYHFLENVGTYNGNPSLKRALEKAYDFYNKNRHTTFHIDRRNLETSRTLYYDEAVNIIKDGLVIIHDLCTILYRNEEKRLSNNLFRRTKFFSSSSVIGNDGLLLDCSPIRIGKI